MQRPLQAQVDTTRHRDTTTIAVPVPARADSILRDSLAKLARQDSIKRATKPDTIKPAIAHAEMPIDIGIARKFYWSRDSLFGTGAITLADLLDRVPGLTMLHAGWIAAPAFGSYMGDVRRVRVFYDGFEVPPLDPRSGGALDLTQINLWSVEDALIEQAPEEIRVYLRSWRVRSTSADTRTDVSTGDQQTNLYRGFFGKRYEGGGDLQFGAQQYGTTPPRIFGNSSDQTGVMGRVGWADSTWSLDAFVTHVGRHRGGIFPDPRVAPTADSIPGVESSRNDAYLRLARGDPDTSRMWIQAMAVASKYDYTGIRTDSIANPKTAKDSAFNKTSLDTTSYRTQYILSLGSSAGPLQLSATGRAFVGGGRSILSPSVRASYALSRLRISAFGEGKGLDSVAREDVTAQLTPLSFVSFLGSVGRATDSRVKDSSFTANYLRGEAGLRIHNLWLLGGILRRDSVRLSPPRAYDTTFVPVEDAAATGVTVGIRGQLWKLLRADVSAVRWNDSSGFYRPRYQTRSELYLRTNLLKRFPTGDFGFSASAVHEYRSGVRFPTTNGGVEVTPGYRTISTLIEIRILSATISWQFRNVLGERYAQVPGLIMPRQTNFYGVRWQFFD
ncbi:MAG TPA: hypothetical protein VHB25_19805 [Gemmatimonadaceae bacterium]|nr:hypothetical protein [Gemmatimonadaceae bacterium]